MPLTLFEVASAMSAVLARLDDMEQAAESEGSLAAGEIGADLYEAIDALQLSFAAKVEGLCAFRTNLLAEADAYKEFADRFAAKSRSLERRAKWADEYLLQALLQAGERKVKAGVFEGTVTKNSRPAITLRGDVADLPAELTKTIPATTAFDNAAAYELWKQGVTLPPQVQVVEGVHLRVKAGATPRPRMGANGPAAAPKALENATAATATNPDPQDRR